MEDYGRVTSYSKVVRLEPLCVCQASSTLGVGASD